MICSPAHRCLHLRPDRIINASGLAVMPGGVDIHCHIAGPAQRAFFITPLGTNAAAKRTPWRRTEFTRSGTLGLVPSTFATGYKYASASATPPRSTRRRSARLAGTLTSSSATRLVSTKVVSSSWKAQSSTPSKRSNKAILERLQMFIAWLLGATKGYAPKLVNPGGVEVWKHPSTARGHGLDDPIPGYTITPRAVIREIVAAANDLGLPRVSRRTSTATNSACSATGAPRSPRWRPSKAAAPTSPTSSSTVTAAARCYVEPRPRPGRLRERSPQPHRRRRPGDVRRRRGDDRRRAAGYFLHKLYGNRWFNCDAEVEAGCGVTAIRN